MVHVPAPGHPRPSGPDERIDVSDTRKALPASYVPDDRSPSQIESDLAATRDRLALTVDSLVDQVSPKRIARRGVAGLKAKVLTPDGRPDFAKLAPVAIAVVGVVGGLVGLRILVRRQR